MVFRRRFTAAVAFAGLAVLALTLGGCSGSSGSGGDPSSGSSSHSGEDQFEVNLVRIAVLGTADQAAFAPVGTDPLARGEVEVEEIGKNEVEVEVAGAFPNATYAVKFFRAGVAVDPTIPNPVFLGSVTTDAQGNTPEEVELNFPMGTTGTFAGVFVLTRTVPVMGQPPQELNEFVTGFRVP